MNSSIILRKKIADVNRVTTGILCTFHFWPGLVEIAMQAKLDYLIIDLEHVTFDAAMVAEACAIGRRQDFPILIRPPAAEFTPIRLAMDLGPCGLMIPTVENEETMRVIQDAVYLRPRGRRRPGGPGNLWVNDVNYESWKSMVEDHLVILPQIETRTGLDNVDAIAMHPLQLPWRLVRMIYPQISVFAGIHKQMNYKRHYEKSAPLPVPQANQCG
jgi:2-keto-3-deoxy-L-rhamnonate aldolase RhmA